ncbi:MAG: hypothetical protein GY716_01140 [bacterium]|nr:hypothetical protein [bacterium]
MYTSSVPPYPGSLVRALSLFALLFLGTTAWAGTCSLCNGRAQVYRDAKVTVMEYDTTMIFPGDDNWMRGYTHYAVPKGLKTYYSGNETVACSRCNGTGTEPGTEWDPEELARWSADLQENAFRYDGRRYLREEPFTNKLAIVRDEATGKYGVGPIYGAGPLALPAAYDAIDTSVGQLPRVRKGGRWGYIGSRGQLMHPVTLRSAGHWLSGMQAVVEADSGVGVIDSWGNAVVPLRYRDVQRVTKGKNTCFLVLGTQGWGALDYNGKQLIAATAEAVHLAETGHIAVRRAAGTTWYDAHGRKVLGTQWEQAVPLSGELFQVWNGAKTGLVRAGGTVVVPAEYEGVATHANYAIGFAAAGTHAAYSLGGKLVAAAGTYTRYDVISAHLVGYRPDGMDLISPGGKTLASVGPEWQTFRRGTGVWLAVSGRTFGVLDAAGKIVTTGVSMSRRGDGLLVVDAEGHKTLLGPNMRPSSKQFVKEKPPSGASYGRYYAAGLYGIVGRDGEVVAPARWTGVHPVEDSSSLFKVEVGRRHWGVYDASFRKMRIPAVWNRLKQTKWESRSFRVWREQDQAIVALDNTFVVPPTHLKLDFSAWRVRIDDVGYPRDEVPGAGSTYVDVAVYGGRTRPTIEYQDGTLLRDPSWTGLQVHVPDLGWVQIERGEKKSWLHLESGEIVDLGDASVVESQNLNGSGARVMQTATGQGLYDFRKRSWRIEPVYASFDVRFLGTEVNHTVATLADGTTHLYRRDGTSFIEEGPVMGFSETLPGGSVFGVDLDDGLPVQCMDGRWAVADRGKRLTDCVYDEIWPLISSAPDPGGFIVRANGRYGVLHEDGSVFIEPAWAEMGDPALLAKDRLPYRAEPEGPWGLLHVNDYGAPFSVSWEPACDLIAAGAGTTLCALDGRWHWMRGGEFERVPRKELKDATLPALD